VANQLEVAKLLQSRTISGKGLFKVAYNEAFRYFWLYAEVIRLPLYNFNNYKWDPPRSEYAKITWNWDGYVIREDVIKYELQRFDWEVDPTGDAAFAITCYYSALSGYLDYLAPFIPAAPLPEDPTSKIYFTPTKNYFDEILISCRDDTAISFELWGLKYNQNCPEATSTPPSRPGSPPRRAPVPPGVGIGDISPPYDPATNDGGNTVPFGGDENPESQCITVIRGSGLNAVTCGSLGNQGDYSYNGFAELVPITFGPNNCPALRLYLDGVDQGDGQTYYEDAIVLSRSGTCFAPEG